MITDIMRKISVMYMTRINNILLHVPSLLKHSACSTELPLHIRPLCLGLGLLHTLVLNWRPLVQLAALHLPYLTHSDQPPCT